MAVNKGVVTNVNGIVLYSGYVDNIIKYCLSTAVWMLSIIHIYLLK